MIADTHHATGNVRSGRLLGAIPAHFLASAGRVALEALHRKRWRKRVRRVAFVGVVLITNLSMLVGQTQAYREIQYQIHAPNRISLSAGPFSYLTHAVSKSLSSLASTVAGLMPQGSSPSTRPDTSPAGRVLPWQAAAPAAPFSVANLATGNVLTEVPIISWQPTGRSVAFSLFHNTLGSEPCANTLGTKWTHSYGRRVDYLSPDDPCRFFQDDGGAITFLPKDGEPGIFESPPGYHMTLVFDPVDDELHLIYKNQDVDIFGAANGELRLLLTASEYLAYEDGVSCGTVLEYEPDPMHSGDRLARITDSSLNELFLHYDDATGCLIKVEAPPIGPPTSLVQRVFEIEYTADAPPATTAVLRVSTARRSGEGDPWGDPEAEPPILPDPPKFWAEFHTNDAKLTQVIDYPVAFEPNGDPAPGTPYSLTYDADGKINTVTLADGLPEEQTRTFTFEEVGFGGFGFGFFGGGAGGESNPFVAKVSGARQTPDADVTSYFFTDQALLRSIVDPLGRTVMTTVTRDADLNPTCIRNILGGETVRTFDDRGNALTVQPPVGGMWEYQYDSLNNMMYVKDPLGYETNISYGDPKNPTKPTFIDGPGVSDMSLAWGQGVDDQQKPTFDIGSVRATYSPNGVEQTFLYGAGEDGDIGGLGQLQGASHGRGVFDQEQTPCPVSDGAYVSDSTGNVSTSAAAAVGCVPWASCPCPSPGANIKSHGNCSQSPPDPGNTYLCGSSCSTEFDADGNAGICSPCGGAKTRSGEIVPSLYNGKNQPVSLPQIQLDDTGPRIEDVGYLFEYDALGRKVRQDAVGEMDTYTHQFQPHLHAYFNHTVEWHYADQSGTLIRIYTPGREPDFQDAEWPIITRTETDLAGRVTKVWQNGVETLYEYEDSTTVPALTVTKPDGTASEYYVDIANQVRKIVHKDAGGDEELAFVYHRDYKGRVVQIEEYVEEMPEANVTTFEYGHGHLALDELDADSAAAVEPEKFYYSWFEGLAGADYFNLGGDPNRLVKEVRTGAEPYYNEYRYDAGGNRLAKIEKIDHGTPGQPDYRISQITRFNYAYSPDWDWNGSDPYQRTGEPDPSADPGYDWSFNSYDPTGLGAGQDKLLSYTTYLFDGDGRSLADQPPIFTVYEWNIEAGMMSRRMSWDGTTDTQLNMQFTYSRGRLQSVLVDEITWTEEEWGGEYDPYYDNERYLEVYGYNIFGERVGVMHCPDQSTENVTYPDAAGSSGGYWCSRYARIYDYVDGRILVEREAADTHGGPRERFDSVYIWGPTGLIARRGVSERNGYWDPDVGELCDEAHPELGKTGALVADDPNAMREYTYMSDHMGNIVGLVDCENETGHRQVFDAFGNVIGDFVLLRCASDHDWTDNPCHLSCVDYPPTPPCPREAPLPVSRMQTGGFNWRGNEGSITDRVLEDMPDTETHELRWSAYERPSTGFVYMQARYYEPATGRFLTADPVPYGLEIIWGQNNRWTYCANDPVNCSDPSGMFVGLFDIAFFLGSLVGAWYAAMQLGDKPFSWLSWVLGLYGGYLAKFALRGVCSALPVSAFTWSLNEIWQGILATPNPVAVFGIGFFSGYWWGALNYTIWSIFI